MISEQTNISTSEYIPDSRWSFPLTMDPLLDIQSRARFILVVEKDATFQKLLDDGFLQDLAPSIIITVSVSPNLIPYRPTVVA